MSFDAGVRVHFVGVGGVGMSALAELLHRRGYRVTGSDRESSMQTERLRELGLSVRIGHSGSLVDGVDLVVTTPAVPGENPEIQAATQLETPILKRAELLEDLTTEKRVVAIAGTHGKTTTTAMTGAVASEGKLDPTIVVGGAVRGLEANQLFGEGDTWVVEADEFDRSFLHLNPETAVVTSLEADHLDSYGTYESLCDAFREFVSRTARSLVLCADDPGVCALGEDRKSEVLTFGLGDRAQIRADRVVEEGFKTHFEVRNGADSLGELTLQTPGLHNVRNALAAVSAGILLEIPWPNLQTALESFRGVHRRFEVMGEAAGVTVVNDYAHHPTAVRATLEAARRGWNGRVVAVFQPHLYSRTRDLADAFGRAFQAADEVWIADVYAAREAPIPGIDGETIADRIPGSSNYVPDLATLEERLHATLRQGDLVVVMGAGNVEELCGRLLNRLSKSDAE